jgi:hypothetical protein
LPEWLAFFRFCKTIPVVSVEMSIQSTLLLLLPAWATLLLLSIAVYGFQNNPRNPCSQVWIHIPQRYPLQLKTLNSVPREIIFRRSRIRLFASAQDQDASTTDHVNGDGSSPLDHDTEEFRVSFNEMEIQEQQDYDKSSAIDETSWSYWSTGFQLVQAGAVGATTGLLVAIFKLVRP